MWRNREIPRFEQLSDIYHGNVWLTLKDENQFLVCDNECGLVPSFHSLHFRLCWCTILSNTKFTTVLSVPSTKDLEPTLNINSEMLEASSNTGSGGVEITQTEQNSNCRIQLTLLTLEKIDFSQIRML